MRDGYTSIVARLPRFQTAFLTILIALSPAAAQQKREKLGDQNKPKQEQPQVEQEPPEEDESSKPKEYAFNPLQAEKEMKVGAFYMKKKSYKAAARRYREATRWDPNNADAFLRLAEAEEKLHDDKASHEAYAKYLELQPDSKDAAAVRKKLEKRP
jgi:predicted Zn-dependent protease